MQIEPSDSSYMPAMIAVLAGDTVGGLKELKQVSIPSSSRESILLSGVTEVCGYGCVWGGGGEGGCVGVGVSVWVCV